MAKLPLPICPTLLAVDAEMENRGAASAPRTYLGASSIGEPCSRKLWYRFRWVAKERFSASTLAMFDDGHNSEDVIVDRLRNVPGISLSTGPDEERQWRVEAFDGHFVGHLDGAILGLKQDPTTWHVLEVKCTAKVDQLAKLITVNGEALALKMWNAVYYAQAIIYMYLTGMTKHYLIATSPGARQPSIALRTDADPREAVRLLDKANRIIYSQEPPSKIGGEDFYLCRICSFSGHCHNKASPDRNCRTCIHSSPSNKGEWKCAKFNTLKDDCVSHRFIPALVPGEQIDVRDENVIYNIDGREWVDDGTKALSM